MKNWTETKALEKLREVSGVEIRGKIIVCKNGLSGLTRCSALDFLVNHCGYTPNLYGNK